MKSIALRTANLTSKCCGPRVNSLPGMRTISVNVGQKHSSLDRDDSESESEGISIGGSIERVNRGSHMCRKQYLRVDQSWLPASDLVPRLVQVQALERRPCRYRHRRSRRNGSE
jgi:hypothetical protein